MVESIYLIATVLGVFDLVMAIATVVLAFKLLGRARFGSRRVILWITLSILTQTALVVQYFLLGVLNLRNGVGTSVQIFNVSILLFVSLFSNFMAVFDMLTPIKQS
ncbi:hypothetical protein COT72_04810 [archaeon CG10_big_fil_rev_8_21_14_0_10_43_11]|nr:MAG: hypothetical protein COT72_04810 [archaeon CG10_big_fil_rev_8_21_14_0_10_43_11]